MNLPPQPQQQFTSAELLEIKNRQGHFIFIDDKPVRAAHLKAMQGLFTYCRETDYNALSKVLYFTSSSIQQSLF